jgi:hypothetical protein
MPPAVVHCPCGFRSLRFSCASVPVSVPGSSDFAAGSAALRRKDVGEQFGAASRHIDKNVRAETPDGSWSALPAPIPGLPDAKGWRHPAAATRRASARWKQALALQALALGSAAAGFRPACMQHRTQGLTGGCRGLEPETAGCRELRPGPSPDPLPSLDGVRPEHDETRQE